MNQNRINRSQRMSAARLKGSHTRQDWIQMIDFFEGFCVKCFGASGLENVERDHIIPVYQNGSDGIDNLQPLCAKCNSSKGPERIDYRPMAAIKLRKLLPEIYKPK